MQRVIQHIYILPLFASMLFSLKSFRLNWPTPYKTFSILLIYITTVEIISILWKYLLYNIFPTHFSNSNLWLYNCFLIPQYLLYMLVFYQIINSLVIKKIIIISAVVYTLFAILNNVFLQSIFMINSFTLILASIIVIFLTVSYFEELKNKKDIENLAAHPMTRISLGAFIFHCANLPYMISLDYLIHNNIPLAVALFYIYLGLNCIMYSLYLIAFLCRYPLHK